MKPTRFPFFDLPGELRTAVLEHLVIIHSKIPVWAQSEGAASVASGPQPPMRLTDLLLVCQQMNREASGLFYTRNSFVVDVGSRRMYDKIIQPGELFSPGSVDARRRVRRLSLRMRRISGDFEAVVAPALADMILHGALRILDLGILPQHAGLKTTNDRKKPGHALLGQSQGGPDGANLVKTSPFQAVLRLLADPDLEKVTLWVSGVHWSLWCPYHDPQKGSSDTRIKLDWRRLVRDFADGNRITKIERPRFA